MEETKNIPPKKTAENIPEEITTSEENILPQTETIEITNTEKDMEVHTHTARKKLTHYLLGFLMLFFAVFI